MEAQKLVDTDNYNIETYPEIDDYTENNMDNFDIPSDALKVNNKMDFGMTISDNNFSIVRPEDEILSRQKRQFPVFGFLSFLMLIVNSVLLINENININNNNNNNNNNENMNTNGGRRLFKMINDFASNVAENFGIYETNDFPDQKSNQNQKDASNQKILSAVGPHVPVFGKPETVFDPNFQETESSSLQTTTVLPSP